jgi:hypothetical protein
MEKAKIHWPRDTAEQRKRNTTKCNRGYEGLKRPLVGRLVSLSPSQCYFFGSRMIILWSGVGSGISMMSFLKYSGILFRSHIFNYSWFLPCLSSVKVVLYPHEFIVTNIILRPIVCCHLSIDDVCNKYMYFSTFYRSFHVHLSIQLFFCLSARPDNKQNKVVQENL